MASFGGSVKLTGESEYRAALRQITQNLKEVSSEMKVVSSQYSKTDTSTQALTAKQNVLNEKLEQQKQRLSTLQAQYAKMSDSYTTNTQKHGKLVASYEQEKAKLERIGQELGTTSPEYKKQEEYVKQLGDAVEKSTKNQDANARSMSNMRIQINNAKTDINKTQSEIGELDKQLAKAADSADDMGDSMAEASTDTERLGNAAEDAGEKANNAGGGGFTILKGALANLAGNVIQSAISGIQNLAGEAIQNSDALKEFESTMSFAEYDGSQIQKAKSEMKDYADKTVYDLKTVANTTAQLAANGVPNYTKLTEAAGNLNAVAGGSADTFQSVAMVLTQTAGAGKLTTENWNQLADAVPGASGKLQEAMLKNGAYTGNFRDAMEKGQITADEFNEAIMDLGFTDAAEKAAKSTEKVKGAVGNMQAAVTDGLMQIYDAIGSENVTGFINGISDAVSKVVPPIKKSVKWFVDNLPTIKPLIAGIASALGTVMVAQKIEAMVTAFKTWKTATEGLTVAQRILNAVQLSSPIGLVIGLIAGLVAGIVVLWNTNEDFRNAVTAAWNKIQEVVGTVADALGTFFTHTVPDAVNTVKGAVVGFFTQTIPDAFNNALNAITSWGSSVGETISQLPQKFTEWLGGVIGSIANWATNLAQQAADAGSKFVNGLMNFIQNLPYNIGFVLGTVIGTVVSWVVDFVQNAVKAGSEFVQNVVKFVQQLPNNIGIFLQNVISEVVSWVTNMISNATNAGTQFNQNVIKFIQRLPSEIGSFLTNVISTVGSWVSQMASKAADAGSKFINGVVQFVQQLPAKIGSFLSQIISNLGSWASQMGQKGADGARRMFDAVVNGIQSLPSRVASIGGDIVKGIWNGISGAAGWLEGQVKSFASGILDGMKSALGIHSPSTLFRDQVGKYIAQGIGVGFTNEMGNVTRQMQDSMPDATAFTDGISANYSVSGGIHGTSTVDGNLVDAVIEALGRVHVVLDDEVAGRFVERTVANAIYS